MGLGRDPAADADAVGCVRNAGFTRGEPWLPLASEHRHVNVENQGADGTSLLALHRRLLQLRRACPALAIGDYRPIAADGDLLLYQRVLGRERLLVALNLGADPIEADFANNEVLGEIVLSTKGDRLGETIRNAVALRDNEGLVIALAPAH